MEKGLNEQILEHFKLNKADVRTFSPLTLAYIGDGIYDLVIRTFIVSKGNRKVNQMHRETSELVQAKTQSVMIGKIMSLLTEEEITIYKRGRNANKTDKAKNATIREYRRATGFEAVIGYLYLKDETKRILELIEAALEGYS